jgi:hypothetical protein
MEVSSQLHALAALPPEKEPPVPIGQDVGWALEPGRMLWRRGRSLTPAEDRIPAVHSIVSRYTD